MKRLLMGVLLGGAMACAQASSLPEGSFITGMANGIAEGLLGLDQGFAAVAGSNVTALAGADLEYLTSDFGIAIDFFTDGRVQVYDNGGFGTLAGVTTLDFSFAGLTENIVGFSLLDSGAVSGGSISLQVLNTHAVRLTISNLSFANAFDAFTAQVVTSPVPEPHAALLGMAGLVLLAARRRMGSPA